MSKTQAGMMLKVLCTTGVGATVRYVADINVKVCENTFYINFVICFLNLNAELKTH